MCRWKPGEKSSERLRIEKLKHEEKVIINPSSPIVDCQATTEA